MGTSKENPKVFVFSGEHFKRWQKKMNYLLTFLKVVYVLTDDCPPENEMGPAGPNIRKKWVDADYKCRNEILNHLDDSLYDIYSELNTAKELWGALQKEYLTEDAGTKKYAVEKFLEFVMEEEKSVLSQVRELQKIIYEIKSEGMDLPELFLVASTIHKLPPS